MPTLLWTDGLVFLLILMVGMFVLHVRRHDHLRRPWRTVLRSHVAMASAVILSIYLLIGFLDSLHFHPKLENPANVETQYSTQIKSVFDVVVGHLLDQDEKTYSAPFATHQFSKETVENSDGTSTREYPRLKFAGSHLADPVKDKTSDVINIILKSTFKSLLIFVLLSLLVIWRIAVNKGWLIKDTVRSVFNGEMETPWLVILMTLGVILWLLIIAWDLSHFYHIFGTDKVGQDVFYQAMKSIRTGLIIGTLTTLVMLPFAVLMGISAGYFRGWIDDVIQYIYTTLNSIPGVLLIAASILMLQVYMSNHAADFTSLAARSDMRLLFLCIILGVTSWTGLCRLLRGETMKLREVDYIQAAQAFGVGNMTIITRHILPNVMHIILISVVLDFSGLVLAEAVLSYINIGVDPSMNSWGNMINSARMEMAREPIVWWSLAAAFVFMFVLVLAANLFSDAVRDAFDPRLREREE